MILSPAPIRRRTSPTQAAHQILAAALLLGLLFAVWESVMLNSWGLYRPEGILEQGLLVLLTAVLHTIVLAGTSLGLHVILWWRTRAVDQRDFRTRLPVKLAPALLLVLLILEAYGQAHARGRLSGLTPAMAPRTNLLLVTLDTLRADHLGCYGNPEIRTPHLDRLARQGRLYTDATCPVPMTTPSHATMLCGTIPAQHGAVENAYRLGPENVTLAERLRLEGYRTAAFVSAFTLHRRFGLDQGFELYSDRFIRPSAWRESIWGSALTRLIHRRRLERPAEETNAAALPWLRAHADESFFLWVHYFDPHAPYEPPPPYDRLYQGAIPRGIAVPAGGAREEVLRASHPPNGREDDLAWPLNAYKGEVEYLDDQVGRLLGELHRLGLHRRTLVAVLADHGESLGERGYFFSHGRYLYQNEMHVPLLIQQPRGGPGIVPGLTDLVGLAPELARGLGLAWEPRLEPVEPQESEESKETEGMGRQQPRLGGAAFALLENRGIVLDPEAIKTRGVRSGAWKLVVPQGAERPRELYDLAGDPGETRDLAEGRPEVVQTLADALEAGFVQAEGMSHRGEPVLDEETLAAMESLGYLGEGGGR